MVSSKEGRSSKFYVFGVGALVIAVGAVVYFHVTRNQNVASAREFEGGGCRSWPAGRIRDGNRRADRADHQTAR